MKNRRTTTIGALIGAIFGVAVNLCVLTGYKIFFWLALPAIIPVLLLTGTASTPSVSSALLNAFLYGAIGAFIGWLCRSRDFPSRQKAQ